MRYYAICRRAAISCRDSSAGSGVHEAVGMDTSAVIGHRLGQEELRNLGDRLPADRSPELAHATGVLAALLVAANPLFCGSTTGSRSAIGP
jgi:hypothetical protein